MPLAAAQTRATERDAFIERDVVADFCRLADQHAHSVIDEEALTDRRSGVDFDTRCKPDEIGEEARNDRNVGAPQFVNEAMRGDRVEAGIT